MSVNWPTVPLAAEVKLRSGGTPKMSVPRYWGGDIPWVSSGEMAQSRIFDTEHHVTEEGAENGTRLVPANTVLIVVRGMSLAKEFRVSLTQRPLTFNQDLKALEPSANVDSMFLYYYLRSQARAIRDSATEASHGTKKLETRVIEEWPLPVPTLPEQKAVVDVLSAYDDLIENNRRRIQLIEAAARLLYKEWFVHLRFPGHDHVKITHGVPEGWMVRRLSELSTKIGSGATPRGGETSYQPEGITLIRSMNVYDYRFDDEGLAYINEEQADKLSTVTVEPLDILLNITGASVGRCCIVPSRHLPARVNQHVMIVRIDPKKCRPHFVLHAINSHQKKQALLNVAKAGGATREALTKEFVSSTTITIPAKHLVETFEEIAGRVFEQRQLLGAQNSHLAKARDLLLPRLMNGEIAV